MAAKTKEPTYTFIVTPEVTLRVRRMGTRPELGSLGNGHTQWEYAIIIPGKKTPLFAGTDLYTNGMASIYEAAMTALRFHLPTADYNIPVWFRTDELTTPQFRWFLDTSRPLVWLTEGRELIGQMAGVYMVHEDGHETHFKDDGFPASPPTVGSVSEGTRELIDAKMDLVDPENEGSVTYPNLQNSPFSG